MVAWYVLSKVSYISLSARAWPGKLTKRVIRLVFPTLCSPRKTSLNFLRGEEAGNSLPPAFVGVAGADMMLEGVVGRVEKASDAWRWRNLVRVRDS